MKIKSAKHVKVFRLNSLSKLSLNSLRLLTSQVKTDSQSGEKCGVGEVSATVIPAKEITVHTKLMRTRAEKQGKEKPDEEAAEVTDPNKLQPEWLVMRNGRIVELTTPPDLSEEVNKARGFPR